MSTSGAQLSVVVVSFNTKACLTKCLAAIPNECEIIVVDNASTDGSPETVAKDFPHANLIRNEQNRGFGAANNQGIDAATRPLVLFLNSDAYAQPGAIEALADQMRDPAVVAVGGKLLNPDGTLQVSSANRLTLWAVFCEQSLLEKAFPSSNFFSPYWNTRRLKGTSEVEQVMGACLMIRPVERFDERYFLYCEDTDLCLRLRSHGKILYVPGAVFTHDLGSSSTQRWLAVARYNKGKELYFRIHHGHIAAAFCWIFDRKGAALRMIGWTFKAIFGGGKTAWDKASLFRRVLFARSG